VVLLTALNILEGYNLTRLGDRSVESVHLVAEAWRRAFMDRAEYMGDPDFNPMPVEQMTDKRYADAWRRSIQADSATPSGQLKRPGGFLPPPAKSAKGEPEHAQTTHYSLVDKWGNAVAVTTTLNNGFGSGVTVEGLGFLMNDEMDDFASKVNAPNLFGLVQGPADAIAPGKRPLSSMTPTIVLKDGKLRFVLGSPGGSRIITTVGNILLGLVDGGLNIQEAVDAPRYHHQYLPDVLYLEPGFPSGTTEGLRALGYNLDFHDHWSDGECIAVDLKTGMLEGGQDHRYSFGKAAGY
jgi:gamma-glutamyltranspeptidase/glutathione hydrolase